MNNQHQMPPNYQASGMPPQHLHPVAPEQQRIAEANRAHAMRQLAKADKAAQKDAAKAAKQAEREAKQAERQAKRDAKAADLRQRQEDGDPKAFPATGFFQEWQLRGPYLTKPLSTVKIHLAGARAEVETGEALKRMTLTRVVGGTILLPGIGTIVGALAKKDATRHFLAIDNPVEPILIEVSNKQLGAAKRFAMAVNQAAAAAERDEISK